MRKDSDPPLCGIHNVQLVRHRSSGYVETFRLGVWFEELFVVAFEVLCVVGCGRESAGGHVRLSSTRVSASFMSSGRLGLPRSKSFLNDAGPHSA
jgi:hypothetical protein